MRNPIKPSPTRPIPLPDSILADGWWLMALLDGKRPVDRRVIAGAKDEGTLDRHHGFQHHKDNPLGPGR